MPFGYHGKILRVDLGKGELWIEEKDEQFFRRYMGGGCLGAYYVLQNVKPETDAFDPDNVIVFSGSVVSGFPIAGFTRHSVTSVSPLTGGVADSEAGGYWARGLKESGFDAVVVQGRSPKPVYLLINNGVAELKDDYRIWVLERERRRMPSGTRTIHLTPVCWASARPVKKWSDMLPSSMSSSMSTEEAGMVR